MRRLSFAVCIALASWPAAAQDGYRPPPKITAGDMALNWLAGRYRSPISCVTSGGDTLELAQSITFRHNTEAGDGKRALKVTVFGIEPPEPVERCYNLVQSELLDRSAVLYVHFRYHEREDLGTADFRRLIRDGQLEYWVHRGVVSERPFGPERGDPHVTRVGGGDTRIEVSMVKRGSDAAKLLARFQPERRPSPEDPYPGMRLTLRFYGPDGLLFEKHVVEDRRR